MKRLRILPFLVALALLVAGCGTTGGAAASVNGASISTGTIRDELDAIQGNARYRQIVQIPQIKGETQGTFNSAVVAQLVTRQIVFRLIEKELARRHLEVMPAQLQSAKIDYYRALGNGDVNAGKQVFDSFPSDYQDQLARWNAEVLLLQGVLAGVPASAADQAQAYFEAHPEKFEEVCASHILVDTKAEAQALKDQLDAGADFATLAKANSKDTGTAPNGGDLGCALPDTFQPEFAAATRNAPIGKVVGPVKTVYGYHLIKVSDRKTPTFDEAGSQVEQTFQNEVQKTFGAWLDRALRDAKVDVNSRYGSWDGKLGKVDPPEGPSTPASKQPGGATSSSQPSGG